MDWRWASMTVVTASAVWLMSSAHIPASPIVAGRDLGPELAALEAKVSKDPNDAVALSALADAYLQRRAPGLAQAALDRAPAQVREFPAIADARARTLSALGRADIALGLQESVLSACATLPCSHELVGRAERRVRFLSEMVKLGVDDPRAEPELAMVAYRRSIRQARLDLR